MSDKKTYRVRNWKEYNQSLVQRGSLTLWLNEDVLEKWQNPPKSGKRGRSRDYADEVISCALHLKAIYRLSFRALEGFMKSLIQLLKVDLKVPDHTD